MSPSSDIIVRSLRAADLAAANTVYRLAFGTQFGLADPLQFRGDTAIIRTRWTMDPRPCFAAVAGNRVVGSVVGMDWGNAFILGPLTVAPAAANRGVGRRLMSAIMALVAERRFPLAALYTLPNSAKHLHLYESYGFEAQRLTPVMAKMPAAGAAVPHPLSALAPSDRASAVAACRTVTDSVFPGLDLTREITAIAAQNLGETLLLVRDGAIAGFALCHVGPGTEAGSGALFIKFACVRPGAAEDFTALLDACEALAAQRGAQRIIAGVNMAREVAYRIMLARGYRAEIVGVAMLRPNQPGWNRPEAFVLDDWR
ncbi:MAG TPA: GNAT family N-acetyltransferase [Stellaceae bacterium]|nr:GNAT family N-acetyltransferase [Stellaceae bacterium]